MFLILMLLAPGMAKADVGISDNDIAAVFNESVAGNELVASALSLKEMEETEGALLNMAAKLLSRVGPAIGPLTTWARIGSSYSKTAGVQTVAIRWGSNSHFAKNIGNSTLRNLNQYLHNSRIPINNWRTNDPGHLHLWRR